MTKTSLLPQNDRAHALDALRGVAVLGILIMNIQSFAMISASYTNPMVFGSMTGVNKTLWLFSHFFADQKFLSIFSMLFGAGIVLFSDNSEQKGYLPARFYFQKLFWLLVIGLAHGYLLWHGDILVFYALSGAIAFLFRKLSPWVLVSLAVVIFLIPVFNYWLFGKTLPMWPPEALEGIKVSWRPGRQKSIGK
ncbi:MAG: hypothetical protein HC819_10205 [Cyclobacteriaceae bacterium]|nr:hypothetical protein [Cyclobacteriaceae bacterium]